LRPPRKSWRISAGLAWRPPSGQASNCPQERFSLA
jgi:hypothetical protein